MNLQDQVTALMFPENDRVLSRVIPKFFAHWEGGDGGVVNRDGEEEQVRLVEFELEVVDRHPS
jgi:hypothetical protein